MKEKLYFFLACLLLLTVYCAQEVFAKDGVIPVSLYGRQAYYIGYKTFNVNGQYRDGIILSDKPMFIRLDADGTKFIIPTAGAKTEKWEDETNTGQFYNTAAFGNNGGFGVNNYGGFTVLNANHDIKIYNTNDNYYSPIKPPTEFKIIQPSVGYKDTVDGVNALIYYKFPSGTASTEIDIKVNSANISSSSWQIVQHDYNSTTGEGLLKVFARPVPVGKHTINVVLNGQTLTREFERLGGVVDEDGDGIDDRTGLPITPDKPSESVGMPTAPTDGDIVSWLKYIGSLIAWVFTAPVKLLKDLATFLGGLVTTLTGTVGEFNSFISVFFGFLPAPLMALFTALFASIIILGIIRLVRGR